MTLNPDVVPGAAAQPPLSPLTVPALPLYPEQQMAAVAPQPPQQGSVRS